LYKPFRNYSTRSVNLNKCQLILNDVEDRGEDFNLNGWDMELTSFTISSKLGRRSNYLFSYKGDSYDPYDHFNFFYDR